GHTHTDACYKTVTTLVCGQEESEGHTHDDSCYDADGSLICGQEESEGHTHSDSCYKTEEVLICGQEESEGHTHSDACYEEQLVCGLEEHTHTVDCLTDETADVETAADWEATLPELTGDWATDLVAVAQSQLGYAESTANFTLDEDGATRKGYTRYGAWYGNAYGDWAAMFVSFCLYYAGIPEESVPQAAGAYAWTATLSGSEYYITDGDYTPAAGDIAFFDADGDGAADGVGIVSNVSGANMTVVQGDSGDQVEQKVVAITEAVGFVDVTAAAADAETVEADAETEDEAEEAEESEVEAETYTASADGVTVTVTAPVGALPENVELIVTLLDEDSDAYTEAAEAVGYDAEDEDTGMAAMDISFYDGDGLEVEPTAPVSVSIDASALLPEEADAETIEVQHLTETGSGVEATLVADADNGVDAETVTAEFEVESFSTFTIQWSANKYDSTAITTTCYFSSDGTNYATNDALVPAGVSSNQLWVGYDNEVDFDDSNSLLAVDGYTLDHAVLCIPSDTNGNYTSVTITSIRAITSWSTSWTYEYLASGSSTWTEFTVSRTSGGRPGSTSTTYTAYLYLYYNVVASVLTGDLTITDDIANSGSLVATYDGDEELTEGSYYYKWYKQNTTTGEYELIEGEIEDSLAVYIDGARETYKVELVWTATDEVIATSYSYQVPYYNQLQNGSFENPTVPSSNDSMQYTSGLYEELVWLTTGFGSLNTSKEADGQDIEIVKASGGSGWNETVAADGDQYAELNAEANGTLYQDVMTIPGVPLYWQAAHEARYTNGVDVMCVIIVDAEFAEKHLTSQDDIDAVVSASGLSYSNLSDGESVSTTFNYTVGDETVSITIWLCASDSDDENGSTNDAWNYFYGTYQVPEGQYLTRFLFGAVSTCSGDVTVGNLLDDVSFSQTPPVSSKSGNITVTKTVEGLDADEVISAGSYTFTVKKSDGTVVGTVSLPTADATVSQTYYWTYTLTNLTAGNYYVEETLGSTTSGYTYVSTTSTPDGTTGTTSANFTVTNGNTSTVTFTNTYQKATTSIILKKVDSKNNNTTLSGAVFTLSGSNSTYTTKTDGTVTIENITYGTEYTLTETTAPDGYNLLTEPIKFTISGSGTVTFTSGNENGVASATTENGSIVITVKNEAGYVLPSTGGSGTWLYTLTGTVLCCGAALLLWKRRVTD
ncbi:MAG: CHAP domain-containing protein, partial [Clostridiales bacterium]|nr:CHAP domain-containing protein [Clostridiales bacterium]